MAYSADDHTVFSRRMQRFFSRVQALRDEAAKLSEIYTNETMSGADPEFVDTPIATKVEHIAGITYMSAFEAFHENAAVSTLDRTQTVTPFVQIDE